MLDKPRLIFFRWRRANLPKFIRVHLDEHVRCLSNYFDLTLIEEDSDYGEVCDRYQPDLALFESGVYAGPRAVTNTHRHPGIPKIGFFNGDANCPSRSVFLSDMDRWGIDTYFTISVSLAEYLEGASDRLFVWPNFVDPDVYRDYGQPKSIPILFTGSQASHYPWRNRVRSVLSDQYPLLICPHGGWWLNVSGTSRMPGMLYGETYARLINAARVTPTCGSISNEIVRKHFEIPACMSCLVTEKTPALVEAGFIDMENCVFADESNVLDKIDYLFRNEEELVRITAAGYRLVHAKHSIQQRDQLFQWFTLSKEIGPDQKIIQRGPFNPLAVVDRGSKICNSHVAPSGLERVLLRRASEMVAARKYESAQEYYARCLNYHLTPEALLGLAICCLYRGDVVQAMALLERSLKETMQTLKAMTPDPVEWSYFILCLLCMGNVKEAHERAIQFPEMCHAELYRCRAVVRSLYSPEGGGADMVTRVGGERLSIHRVPERDFQSWLHEIALMLTACGQSDFARRLRAMTWSDGYGSAMGRKGTESLPEKVRLLAARLVSLVPKRAPVYKRIIQWGIRFGYEGGPARGVVLWAAKRGALRASRFLPVLARLWKLDECCRAVNTLAAAADVQSVLLIVGSKPSACADAFIIGLRRNPLLPPLFLMSDPGGCYSTFARKITNVYSPGTCRMLTVSNLRSAIGLPNLELVLIDGPLPAGWVYLQDLKSAKFIAVRGTQDYRNSLLFQDLLRLGSYTISSYNPLHRDGYVVLRRTKCDLVDAAP